MKDDKGWQIMFITIISAYCILNIVNTLELTREHKLVNELEKIECLQIGEMIEEYEKQNNIEVKKIIAVNFEMPREEGFFKETKRRTVVTYNNLRHYWGYTGVVQYYLKKDLKEEKMNEEETSRYLKYVEENNIKLGDFVCIGDTLYCPEYIF